MATLPKTADAGDNAVGVTPGPERDAVSGLFKVLVTTVSELAGTAPAVVGVSVIEIVQLAYPASTPGPWHVPPEMAYGAGTVIELMVTGDD